MKKEMLLLNTNADSFHIAYNSSPIFFSQKLSEEASLLSGVSCTVYSVRMYNGPFFFFLIL